MTSSELCPIFFAMATKKISEFAISDKIIGFFAVRKADVREFANGRFVSLELGDSSGRINGVIWEPDHFCLTELEAGMVVKARGIVSEYKKIPQFKVDLARLATDEEYSLEDILPHSTQTVEQRRARILALTEKIENSYIKSLAQSFWDDTAWFDSFLRAPAGKLWHHAYIGGLAEHSANLAELALRVSEGYDFINKDYVVFAGMFHDAGKIRTYSTGVTIDYSDEGRLVGHICIMDELLCRNARKIEGFPDQLLTKLRHLLLSHQGELEYATPVVPQMPEAFIIYYCDEIDSKMGAIERIRNRHEGKGWSEYVRLLGRHLYFGSGEGD